MLYYRHGTKHALDWTKQLDWTVNEFFLLNAGDLLGI